jgi:hypothetical protein
MREKDLMDGENGFWRAIIKSGCLVRRHDGSVESARGLVGELAGMKRTVLRLQEEIAEGKKLIETDAGVSLNEELLRVKRQHEEELRCVKEEMEAAMKSGLFPLSNYPFSIEEESRRGRTDGDGQGMRHCRKNSRPNTHK